MLLKNFTVFYIITQHQENSDKVLPVIRENTQNRILQALLVKFFICISYTEYWSIRLKHSHRSEALFISRCGIRPERQGCCSSAARGPPSS